MGKPTAINDIVMGMRRWPDWLSLAWYDFVLPHRRAVIGPLWEMFYVVVWAAGLSVVFMGSEAASGVAYVPYVASGVTLFGFISNILTGSPGLFRQRANLILNISAPLTYHVYRLVAVSTVKLLFQLPVVLVAVLLFSGGIGVEVLWALPALLIYLVTAVWATLLMAIAGTRYGDVQFAARATMRFLFFLSPIFWVPVEGTMRAALAAYNPLTYYLDILRLPLLGETPPLGSWSIVGAISLGGLIVTTAIFSRTRRLIPFWL